MTNHLQRNTVYTQGPFKYFRGTFKELETQMALDLAGSGEKSATTTAAPKSIRCRWDHYVILYVRVPVCTRKVFGNFRYNKRNSPKKYIWAEVCEADDLIDFNTYPYGREEPSYSRMPVHDSWSVLTARLAREARAAKKLAQEKEAKKLELSLEDYKKKLALQKLEKTNVKYAAERVGLLMRLSKIRTTIESAMSAVQKNVISATTDSSLVELDDDFDLLHWDLERHATRNARLNKLTSK